MTIFTMTIPQIVVLFIASIVAGIMNAVAGGGSFVGVPILIFTGVPPIQSNATNTVALWPGGIASAWAYRKDLATQKRLLLLILTVTSLIGGILGALLLLKTSQSTFLLLLPYLLLIATVLFAFSGQFTKHFRLLAVEKDLLSVPQLIGIAFFQLIISIYGGYFGGGIGILMLASLGIFGMKDINAMNGLKTVLASCINGVAMITFIIAGVVVWPQAIVMIIGAIFGGYGGAYYARKLDQRIIRGFVILVGVSMTIYFFVRR